MQVYTIALNKHYYQHSILLTKKGRITAISMNSRVDQALSGVAWKSRLGDAVSPGLHETSHYLAPCMAWNLPSGWTIRVSPGFGLNDNSHGLLLRWGLSREISGFGEMFRTLFRGRS